MKQSSKKNKKEAKHKNIITGLINIRKEDLDSDIVIISSYENFKNLKREKNFNINLLNGEEIMNDITIQINDKNINNISHYHKFNKEGQYTIKYLYKKNLTKINHMFSLCGSIEELDFSEFDTQEVINMNSMFEG